MSRALTGKLRILCLLLNRLPFLNRLKMGSCRFEIGSASLLLHCRMECHGGNNVVLVEPGVLLKDCRVNIRGNDNFVVIREGSTLKDVEVWIEDDGNVVDIGAHSNLCGQAHFACIEGTRIEIGEDCLFSSGIVFRTGDSHSIIDERSGERINGSANIRIGNHVWIGHHVLVGKGVFIPDGCVVGTGSVVTKEFDEAGCVLAGVPAKVVRHGVAWDKHRL